MKKLKFLLLALVATISVGAWAQKDVTSTYIKNATLSSLDGWTNNNFNTPKQGNNTVGYASEAYAGWGALEKTSYSLTQKITLPKGNYRLVNYSFYREKGGANDEPGTSRAFLKAGEKQVAIKTLGSITPAGYANSQAEGANCFDSKMYRNAVDFTIDADNTEIEIGLSGTFCELKSWCIAGMFELWDLDAEASETEPADMTYLITNPGFEYRDATGWTSTGNGGGYAAGDAFAKSGIGFAEKWQSGDKGGLGNGTFYQEITVPAGLYEVKVRASNIEQYNSDAAGKGMYLVANDEKTQIGTSGTYSAKTKVTTGKLNLGILLDGATGNWIAFDCFELNYLGVDLDDLKSTLASVITDAKALYSSKMNADVLQALKNKVSAAESVEEKASAIKAITEELQNAIAAANKSIADYEALKNAYTLAETLYKESADGATDFNTAISTAKNGYTDADVDGAEAEATMKAAIETYLSANNTGIVVNGTFESDTKGWTSTTKAQNSGLANNKQGDFIGNFWENWNGSAFVGNMSQKNPSAMPAGNYLLRIAAFGNNASDGKLVVFAGDAETQVLNDTPTYYYVPFTLTDVKAAETFEYGLQAKDGNASNWVGIDNVSIYFLDGMNNFYATEDDYKALADALSNVSDKVFGFEAGEYAPYNNVEAAKAVAYAKTVDSTAKNIAADVRLATETINNADWVVNETEVNAVYNGNFGLSIPNETSGVDVDMPGWTANSSFRKVIKDVTTYPGLADAEAKAAAFTWGCTAEYGMTGGYTMPLKASTTYMLTFKQAGWEGANNSFSAKILKDGVEVTSQVYSKAQSPIQQANSLVEEVLFFTTTDAGDYVLNLIPNGNTTWTDVCIVKAASFDATLTKVGDAAYSSMYLDYPVEIPEGVEAYYVTVEGRTATMNEIKDVIPANCGVILKAAEDVDKITFTQTSTKATTDVSNNVLIGFVKDTEVEDGKAHYAFSYKTGDTKPAFYIPESAESDTDPTSKFTAKAHKAYIELESAPNSKLDITWGGEATGINTIDNGQLTIDNSKAYNLNGMRVSSNYKGIVLKGGKKFLQK